MAHLKQNERHSVETLRLDAAHAHRQTAEVCNATGNTQFQVTLLIMCALSTRGRQPYVCATRAAQEAEAGQETMRKRCGPLLFPDLICTNSAGCDRRPELITLVGGTRRPSTKTLSSYKRETVICNRRIGKQPNLLFNTQTTQNCELPKRPHPPFFARHLSSPKSR